MIILPEPNEEEKRLLLEFKNKYYDLYPDYLQEELDESLLLGFTNTNDNINQIYCYLDLVPDKINPYIAFLNILKDNFNLNANILEVGCGLMPILSKYLKKYFPDSYLTLLDKSIKFKNFKDKCIETTFYENYDISKYDLIIGYNPCQASEAIIRNAIKNNKDFCIALCGCCFLPKEYKERTPELWHKYLIDLANDLSTKYKIEVKYFDQSTHLDNPIVLGKYIKQ